MLRHIKTATQAAALFALSTAPMWALGGGTLMATRAVNTLGAEVSGPLAYGLSLIAIVGGSVSWFRHHHDMGALTQGAMGTVVVAGVAVGAASLLGMVPGVAGAVLLP